MVEIPLTWKTESELFLACLRTLRQRKQMVSNEDTTWSDTTLWSLPCGATGLLN